MSSTEQRTSSNKSGNRLYALMAGGIVLLGVAVASVVMLGRVNREEVQVSSSARFVHPLAKPPVEEEKPVEPGTQCPFMMHEVSSNICDDDQDTAYFVLQPPSAHSAVAYMTAQYFTQLKHEWKRKFPNKRILSTNVLENVQSEFSHPAGMLVHYELLH